MAHADYHCCAVCDSKMGYAHGYAETKVSLCTDCMKSLHAFGVMVYDGEDLMAWMKGDDNTCARKLQILRDVGFSKCFYGNDVDTAYEALEEAEDE